MGYSHMFYALDLYRLRSIHGSKDERFVQELLQARGEDLINNDEFFEGYGEDGEFPTSEQALREIVAGECGEYKNAEGVYGYVLKIICEHLGEMIGGDVADVGRHPYKSQLAASGPPIPIPYDRGDFPTIGYLALKDIPAEISRIDTAPKTGTKQRHWLLAMLFGGLVWRPMSAEEAAEDMQAYREVLQEVLDKKLSVVSFRH